MRKYAAHLSRQSILDFSPSSCVCFRWHSPPLHNHQSWLNWLFFFINIHYMTWSCMAMQGTSGVKVTCFTSGVFLYPWSLSVSELIKGRWYVTRQTLVLSCSLLWLEWKLSVDLNMLWYSPEILIINSNRYGMILHLELTLIKLLPSSYNLSVLTEDLTVVCYWYGSRVRT